MTLDQVHMVLASLQRPGSIISIFAGRIADTGVDPEPIVKQAVRAAKGEHSILWASVREVFNVAQASRCGADIITLTPEMIKKLAGFGRDLNEYSIETVRQFARDAEGITL
jgi:transaldolase